MILGIGIDTTDISRFKTWNQKSIASLERLFSHEEITYALKNPGSHAERFAIRFAAKEAFLKAIRQTIFPACPLLTAFKASSVLKRNDGAPFLHINWDIFSKEALTINHFYIKAHLSLSHSDTIATAFVVIESTNMVN